MYYRSGTGTGDSLSREHWRSSSALSASLLQGFRCTTLPAEKLKLLMNARTQILPQPTDSVPHGACTALYHSVSACRTWRLSFNIRHDTCRQESSKYKCKLAHMAAKVKQGARACDMPSTVSLSSSSFGDLTPTSMNSSKACSAHRGGAHLGCLPCVTELFD